jgi:hypothetical protein
MADATFNGLTLTITLPPGQVSVDVRAEIYSAWKEWLLLTHENRRFPPAFTTEGGTDTVPGEVSGRNYFVRNDLGWRVQPSEEDINVTLVGNLFATDSSLPMVIPTVGGFTTLVQIQRSSLALVETTGVVQADVRLIRQMVAGEVNISLDDRTVTVYDEAGITGGIILAEFDISADGRIRLRTT